MPSLEAAWQDVDSSFERFCLTAGIGAMEQMLCEDAQRLAGPRHSRSRERVGQRWGTTKGKIGFHGGKVDVRRPRVRSDGHEVAVADLERGAGRGLAWPLGDEPDADQRIDAQAQARRAAARGRSARPSRVTARQNRRLRAGSWRCLPNAWPSGWPRICRKLDLLVIQIDGLHIGNDLVLVGALGYRRRRQQASAWP